MLCLKVGFVFWIGGITHRYFFGQGGAIGFVFRPFFSQLAHSKPDSGFVSPKFCPFSRLFPLPLGRERAARSAGEGPSVCRDRAFPSSKSSTNRHEALFPFFGAFLPDATPASTISHLEEINETDGTRQIISRLCVLDTILMQRRQGAKKSVGFEPLPSPLAGEGPGVRGCRQSLGQVHNPELFLG